MEMVHAIWRSEVAQGLYVGLGIGLMAILLLNARVKSLQRSAHGR